MSDAPSADEMFAQSVAEFESRAGRKSTEFERYLFRSMSANVVGARDAAVPLVETPVVKACLERTEFLIDGKWRTIEDPRKVCDLPPNTRMRHTVSYGARPRPVTTSDALAELRDAARNLLRLTFRRRTS